MKLDNYEKFISSGDSQRALDVGWCNKNHFNWKVIKFIFQLQKIPLNFMWNTRIYSDSYKLEF